MTTPNRIPLLLAAALGAALPGTAALATPATPPRAAGAAVTASAAQGEGDEILLEVASTWKLKGTRITGTVTNADRSALTGTAKVTRDSSKGTPITLATGGRLAVAAGRRQVVTLTLTTAGKQYFRHRRTASVDLALREFAGTRRGEVGEGIVVRKVT
ncbi:hypothetical protein NBH00_12290 [Paraconexibacter antarcticus]|uniref:DUF5666 domain-containing protein n=1 Tax=Paraconexibacter antarcticus TaxID=2949664 RepID=A0ABY5E022_9ACTN|nr:hypothetical protein [Paraconexibacter antarcticus]UTI66958.1 hypothetical protein NBH00_12290 [Paraconexibacter antarcticus]